MEKLSIDSDYSLWRERAIAHLSLRKVRRFFFDASNNPLTTDRLISETATQAEIEHFEDEFIRAVDELFDLLDGSTQIISS